MTELFYPARFVTTAIWPEHYPSLKSPQGTDLPEIVVSGRSNAGKSTLLNNLFHSEKLVKTSSTPGKTQALNFFLTQAGIVFVDLPGYGYAKVPQKLRKQWGTIVQKYLETRKQLKGLLLLQDIRRLPEEEEMMMINWAAASHIPLIIVLTKTDKLNQSERHIQEKAIKLALKDFAHQKIICYSAPKSLGHKELRAALEEILLKKE